MTDESDERFAELLQMLKETRGFDFTGYKPTTLKRRIRRRMEALRLDSFAEYRDRLELDAEEFACLFDSLLINVTSFFRDPSAWDELRDRVVPEVLAAKSPNAPIRVWSAGCATGPEAYTLAIVFAEALGEEEFRERVKIYATDVDEEALRRARTGEYTAKELADIPEDLRNKYFELSATGGTFRRDLRRQVIFGRNDLTRDAPISRVDLLLARNTLMYFNATTQASIVRRLHFALADPGFLFLGKAEMLLNHGRRFEPVDLRKRLFRKVTAEAPAALGHVPAGDDFVARGQSTGLVTAALDAGPVAQLAVDLAGRLAVANSRADALFNLRPRDIGKPFQDLEVSYRPVELRSLIEQARRERRPVEQHDVLWRRAGSTEADVFNVYVVPLHGAPGQLIGIGVTFADVTRYRRLRDELQHSNEELERAYEELQSLNEELETTNEELQSTNEELETTNEELQSTNEELETTNEEMQSTNDELQEINEVLRLRSEELDRVGSTLSAVLHTLGTAVVLVDARLRVKIWGPGAEDLWGVRVDEADGRDLRALDIGLPLGEITPLLDRVLDGGADGTVTRTVEAVNRRGRPVRLTITCSALRSLPDERADGAMLIMNEPA